MRCARLSRQSRPCRGPCNSMALPASSRGALSALTCETLKAIARGQPCPVSRLYSSSKPRGHHLSDPGDLFRHGEDALTLPKSASKRSAGGQPKLSSPTTGVAHPSSARAGPESQPAVATVTDTGIPLRRDHRDTIVPARPEFAEWIRISRTPCSLRGTSSGTTFVRRANHCLPNHRHCNPART